MAAVDPEGIAVPRMGDLVALRHAARHLTLFPRRQALSANSGNYRSHFRGRGMDFDEVRPYQPGDDIRTIDWRVTARTTRAHTKVFREERERPVLIAVDMRGPMFFGSQRLKSMVATEVAASLAWAGLHANDRVGGLIFSPHRQRDVRSQRSHHNVLRFLQGLGEACADLLDTQHEGPALVEILASVRRAASPGTTVVIISDFHDLSREGEEQLFPLTRHCDLNFAWVRDPLEIDLPPPGVYPVSDGETTRYLDTRDARLRESFQLQQRHQQQLLEGMVNRLGAGLMRFSTREAVQSELARHYGSKGMRRL